MKQHIRWMVLVLITIAGLQLAACGPSETVHHEPPAHIVPIEGTDLSRIELTAKAAERIDVQTVPLREEKVARERTFGGQVVDTSGSALVRVALHKSDQGRVDRDVPAIIRPIDPPDAAAWMGMVVDAPTPKQAAEGLFCLIDTSETGLSLDERVYVKVSMKSSGAQQKIVPYEAVLYDKDGETWVYTNPEPLVYVRAPIVVDYIEGDLAVLSEGPPAGTAVVTAGAGELFGAESGIGGGGGH